ncbi:MAG TPA: pyrroloquinoline quinone-dependent dehydrogenase [Myxococcota bacterium]|nr:pyrroloquinoline quinone-dependent dehydrogenase [Myxococcota bacterium]
MPRAAQVALFAACALAAACERRAPLDLSGPTAEWREYAGDKGGLHWSPLTQVTRANVRALELAWEYRHGDRSDGSDGTTRTSFNATPLVVGDAMYFCTGKNRVIALDAETGRERWAFDPKQRVQKLEGPYPRVCRGVAYWEAADEAERAGRCGRRILTGTIDSELLAIDAADGTLCADFGDAGRVALREGIGEDVPAWEYYPTSPPIVVGDVAVVGALVADNLRADAPAGVVRAFDVRTGARRWAWDPVPPGYVKEPGRTYARGTPNVWSFLSADPALDLVFVPTGSASPDLYGGERHGLDYYGSSVVALRASTGALVWHFQTVHHDVWDYDVPAQPTLLELEIRGERVPALAQITKMGHLFLLDRRTGAPLYPVEERPVPQGGVPGETLSPTQPFPTHPPALHPAKLEADDAFGFTPWDRGKCAETIRGLRNEGIFTPPSLEGSVLYPSNAGGPNWGGVSIDPVRGRLYVNQMRLAGYVKLLPRAEYDALPDKRAQYPQELYPMEGTPYAARRGTLFSPLGTPCTPTPWGVLSAVDLASGEVLWEARLGTTRDTAPFPMWLPLGAPNLGGSLATAGGLVFIGATTEKTFRAFDADSGAELWSARLPYTANATPLSYRLRQDGRQFVVVAAGGHGWSEPGDAVMAFALPAE